MSIQSFLSRVRRIYVKSLAALSAWLVRRFLLFTICTHDDLIDHHQCRASLQLSVDRLMQGDLYSKLSFRTAVAGCYICYRESVGTVVTWPLC